ncbi:hypothetical protein Tco_0728932 [Tanacetum coccineum]|uniref:Uncharacterized protein n=1 Tax=Tanacetum coccineum TaxID=301880 RepID=A0ABQ4YPW1_9ASTR
MVSATKDSLRFNDLMATPIDFSKYVLNRLKINNLTQDLLLGPAYNFLKGTCSSSIELEYNFQECFNALTNKLDWNNPEGDRYPFDMSKPLPLQGHPGHLTIASYYFFNNDLEYLKSYDPERTYTTSITKTKAARYEIVVIEDIVPMLWSTIKHAFGTRAQVSRNHDITCLSSNAIVFCIGAYDGLDGTERGYPRLCLGEMFCPFKQKDTLEKKSIMGEPLSPDRVFDFPMDELEPHLAYDFFVPRLLPGHAGKLNNNNRWIEADVPLLGDLGAEADEPMVGPLVGEIAELMVEMEEQAIALVIYMEEDIAILFGDGDFSDDDSEGFYDEEEVWEVNEEWLMAPITPPLMSVVPSSSVYKVGVPSTTVAEGQSFPLLAPGLPVPPLVIEDLITHMGNLEYGHGQLIKKVIQGSDAEVANGITIREIGPRVSAIEGQVQVMASHMIQVEDRLEQVVAQVEQGQHAMT